MIALVLLFIVSIQMYLLIKYGQTIGKRALGIKIVNESHEGLPDFVKVILLRSFVPNLLYGIPYAGVAICLADLLFIFRDDRRCLHDLIAQTKVINVANNKRNKRFIIINYYYVFHYYNGEQGVKATLKKFALSGGNRDSTPHCSHKMNSFSGVLT